MRPSHHSRVTLLLCAMLVLAGMRVSAQPAESDRRSSTEMPPSDWWIGPHAGAVWSDHSGVPHWWPLDGGTADADGVGIVAGLDASIRFGPQWYLAPVIAYESWRATSAESVELELALIEEPEDSTFERRASVIVESEIDYALVRTTILFGTIVLGAVEETSLAVELGPTNSLIVAGTLRRQMRLAPSETGRFANRDGYPMENDGRTMTLFDGDIPERVGMRIGLLGGVRLWHRFRAGLDAWAALRYDVALTGVDELRWRASALLLTAGVQIDL